MMSKKMETINDLEQLHMFHYGKPVGQVVANYPTDPLKIKTAPDIISKIISILHPTTCLDVGCGTGVYVEEFNKQSVKTIGVDGNLATKTILKTSPENVLYKDIRHHLELNQKYDLVFCIELIEHIEEKYEDILLFNLTQHTSNWLLVTTGEDTKGKEKDHLNEKPVEYWKEKITDLGFKFKEDETLELRKYFKRTLPRKFYKKKTMLHWFSELLLLFELESNDSK